MIRSLCLLIAALALSAPAVAEDEPSTTRLVDALRQNRPGAAKALEARGKPAYAALKAARKASKDAAFVARADQVLGRIAWGKGLKELRRLRERADQTPSENRAGPHRIEPIQNKAFEKLWPEHRFYRLRFNARYSKPGQGWHGTLYAIRRFDSQAISIYRVGQAMVPGWNRLLTLEGHGIELRRQEQVKELAASGALLLGSSRALPTRHLTREANTWRGSRVAGATSGFVLTVDAKHRPVELTFRW